VLNIDEEVRMMNGNSFVRQHSLAIDYVKGSNVALQQGQKVRVDVHFTAHEWQDKYFQKVRAKYINLL